MATPRSLIPLQQTTKDAEGHSHITGVPQAGGSLITQVNAVRSEKQRPDLLTTKGIRHALLSTQEIRQLRSFLAFDAIQFVPFRLHNITGVGI